MGSPADRIAFRQRPKLIHAGRLGPGYSNAPVSAASAKEKLVVPDRFPTLKGHRLQPGVHTENGDPGAKLNAVVPVPFGGLDEPAAEVFLTTHVGLGKGRPSERNTGLLSQHHDAARPALLPEGHRGISAGQPRANDDGGLVRGQPTIPCLIRVAQRRPRSECCYRRIRIPSRTPITSRSPVERCRLTFLPR